MTGKIAKNQPYIFDICHLGQMAEIKGVGIEFAFEVSSLIFGGVENWNSDENLSNAAKKVGFDFDGVSTPENESDFYSVRYAEFVVPLVKAMQEQQKTIEELQATVRNLLKRIQSLE